MFKRKTVIVVGAGCSKELGLPLGSELVDNLHRRALEGSVEGERYSALERVFMGTGPMARQTPTQVTLRQFANGLHTKGSIDQYLDFHRDNPMLVTLGKIAISQAILGYENRSRLNYEVASKGLHEISNTWISKLFKLMNDDTDVTSPHKIFHNLTFVCFNYDRCIEVFFYYALNFLAQCGFKNSADIQKSNLRIIHPYGTVGDLNFDEAAQSPKRLLYGPNQDLAEEISAESYKRIRTFTEGMHSESEKNLIERALTEAEQAIFLGFSYLDQNMELLSLPEAGNIRRVFATTYGLSQPDINIAKNAIFKALNPNPPSQNLENIGNSLRFDAINTISIQANEFMDQYGNTIRR